VGRRRSRCSLVRQTTGVRAGRRSRLGVRAAPDGHGLRTAARSPLRRPRRWAVILGNQRGDRALWPSPLICSLGLRSQPPAQRLGLVNPSQDPRSAPASNSHPRTAPCVQQGGCGSQHPAASPLGHGGRAEPSLPGPKPSAAKALPALIPRLRATPFY